MQTEPVQKVNAIRLGIARSLNCVEMVCDGEVEDNYHEEARVSLVAVAESLEGDPYGPHIHISIDRSAFSRTKGGGREPVGLVPRMRQPPFFGGAFVGTDAVNPL